MSEHAIIARIDELATPLGFSRAGTTWNRHAKGFVDVLNFQESKSHDAFTLNVGIMNTAVYTTCWGTELSGVVDDSSCIVRTRLGNLGEGRDIWWPLHQVGIESEIVPLVSKHAIPFMDRMHSIESMEEFLTGTEVVRKQYPLPVIYLAIIRSQQGNMLDACAILAGVIRSVVGPWRIRASEAAMRIGCTDLPLT